VAARNGSHHQSHGVAKIHLRPGSGSGVMHWALPPQTINFANQRAAFSARLEGQGVLAPLGAVIASLAGRLPI
jgi:hypothetical protein